jgi:hypothetical protein
MKQLIDKVEWERTPVVDEEFDKERMEILGMKMEEYAAFCEKLSIDEVLILNGDNKANILKLKRKYVRK